MNDHAFFRLLRWLAVLIPSALLLAVWSLTVGAVEVPFTDIVQYLRRGSDGSAAASILLQVRFPRMLLGMAVGSALSVSGVVLQGLFRNPLVEPYTLGISGGAALGVCLNLVFRWERVFGLLSVPGCGFLGALAAGLALYALSVRRGRLSLSGLLLFGVMLSFVCSSCVMLVMALMRVEDLQGIVFWIMGSLDQPDPGLIRLMSIVTVLGSGGALTQADRLNAFALGEEGARQLGVNTELMKKFLFGIAAVLTGCSVAVSGIIGFVGLIVPHLMRWCVGSDHRVLIPLCFVCGGSFLLLCDTASRTVIAPLELPVGVVTGLVGGALFIFALSKRSGQPC